MCNCERAVIIKSITVDAANLLKHFEDEGNVCELLLNRIELAVKLLRDTNEKNS